MYAEHTIINVWFDHTLNNNKLANIEQVPATSSVGPFLYKLLKFVCPLLNMFQ